MAITVVASILLDTYPEFVNIEDKKGLTVLEVLAQSCKFSELTLSRLHFSYFTLEEIILSFNHILLYKKN